jgi:hypothetical protein
MPNNVILTNVRLCALDHGQNRTYVPNSGKIAKVSDRTDLRDNSESFERRPETVKLDAPRVNCVDRGDVGGRHS